jgi:hypothetical protein
MHSWAYSLAEPGKIKRFVWRITFANDFQKLEGPCMLPSPFARMQSAECLTDCSLLVAAGHSGNDASRVNAQRSRAIDFIFCREPGRIDIGGTEVRNELRREHVHD